MHITKIQLKNFRCFDSFDVDIHQHIVLLEGGNGVGKTSLLEALHYVCYLRSFRTHIPKDLVYLEQQHFFIKVGIWSEEKDHEIQVGFSGKKRLVKLNQKAIQSFKELLDFYRVVTLTEDDLVLIKGGPDVRRSFIDQALILFDATCVPLLKKLRTIIDNRNALLYQGGSSTYQVWTDQLIDISCQIQVKRRALLQRLEIITNELLTYFGEGVTIQLTYDPKHELEGMDAQSFLSRNPSIYEEEMRMKRSLFGAHLDDFSIHFRNKKSKTYASRGQQKLITVLLKIAQMKELILSKGSAIFLLDDFLTDFDEVTAQTLIDMLINLNGQLIFTTPIASPIFEKSLPLNRVQRINLSNRIAD